MLIIGEGIHIISKKVKEAIDARNKKVIQGLALEQAKAGANLLDINIGPQKKLGHEIMPWMVDTVQEVVDIPLSLDTTNAAAIEAGLKRCKRQPLINSTDASPERLSLMMPLAAKYNARIIALALTPSGLPPTAEARIELAMNNILPAAEKYGVPTENLFLDPIIMTVTCGDQSQILNAVNAVRFFREMVVPPPKTTGGLSNVSNGAPAEVRPLLNRMLLIMLLGAGIDSAIMDATDEDFKEILHILQERHASTPKGKLYLALYDTYKAGETFDSSAVDKSDPEVRDLVKTIEVLENKWLYAHSYLKA